ncbi:hypothetical protein GR160_04750 [Flavobacterium sp. Sd200]|uniref:hypothetical protein n=1 Tax=Flavobacterium sp. Sd200 TaxID=2692211 RepID=UPI0013712777|nr:hypothetical protein [Flavobacterium sp. Sd200]MXN90526.1 hypothetical protein [Flavobacterium sp. Sd200]
MKTKLINTVLFSFLLAGEIFAQDVTTVRANNSDISDNLNLQAVASIFGDSRDLEDFERRLNDPDAQISNLDLNGDNRVDYLRVIEVTENNTHVIILQSVLGEDTFQDVATIEVERDNDNNVTVQVVGDTYIYGSNYIYEPVYVVRPPLFNVFWVSSYRPYYSPWYYGYYPTYYTYWAPCAPYRYRNHIHTHINVRNTYVYVNTRRSSRAVAIYNTRRTNAYERQHPNNSFSSRNNNAVNRYQLEQTRGNAVTNRGTRSLNNATLHSSKSTNGFSNSSRYNGNNVRVNNTSTSVRSTPSTGNSGVSRNTKFNDNSSTDVRSNNSNTVRNYNNNSTTVRSSSPAKTYSAPQNNNSVRSNQQSTVRSYTPASNNNSVRSNPSSSVRSQNTPTVRSTPAAAPQRQASPSAPTQRGGGRRGN